MEGKQSKIQAAVLALLFASLAVATFYFGFNNWLPVLASEHGGGIDSMIKYLFLTTGIIFLIGHFILAFFIWKYGNQETVTHRTVSKKTELKWTIIPVLLMSLIAEGGVITLGIPVWEKINTPPKNGDAVIIEVTAEQFTWNVRYPGADSKFGESSVQLMSQENPLGLDDDDETAADDIFLLNEIKIPINKNIQIKLRAKDVLHSFNLPSHRVKQDAVPGMNITVRFVPTLAGEFELTCAELCGLGHYRMKGYLTVLEEEEYNNWLKEVQQSSLYFPKE